MNLQGKEILIIDDNPDLLFIMRSILANTGATVSEALGASEGYRRYQERAPHLIICDLGMKPHSGFDFLRLLRGQANKLPVPVLVLSGDNSKTSVVQAFSLGVSDYLIKPVETPMLLRKIRKSLKNNEFSSVELSADKQKNIAIEVPATIIAASEAGFRVNSTIRIAPNTKVKLKSELITTLQLDDHPVRTGPGAALSLEKGFYQNEIRLVGVSEEIASRIRKCIRFWK